MPSKIVEQCTELLVAQELTIAFAESATVGRMAAEFGITEDAGKILKGGIVCYDAGVKEDLLKVDDKLVEKYTPESAEVTEAAAKGLRSLIPADIHVAITGLTCPGGSETPEKPVGTMFIHCIGKDFQFADRKEFTGSKEVIIMKCIENFAALLTKQISPEH
jgi:nicotinamide-nucleotide amidase